MTNIDDVRDKLNSTIDEQADTIARLELKLAIARLELELEGAKNTIEAIRATLTDRDSERAALVAYQADADALRALAAWSAKDGGRTAEFMRRPLGGWSCDLGADGYCAAFGTGATLASAIMDALGNVGK